MQVQAQAMGKDVCLVVALTSLPTALLPLVPVIGVHLDLLRGVPNQSVPRHVAEAG